MRDPVRRTPLLLLLLLVTAGSARAAVPVNLVQNPGFATSILYWEPSTSPAILVGWSSLDRDGSPASGSAQLSDTTYAANDDTLAISQCVHVLGGRTYMATLDYDIPAGQARTGSLFVEVNQYTDASCGTLWSGFRKEVTQVGGWTHFAVSAGQVGTSVQSARIGVYTHKVETGGSLTAYVDNVRYFTPLCTESDTTRCLGDARFQVSATWHTSNATGAAQGYDRTTDTGAFWFFSDSNIEMLVKVLDGCPVNQRFWIYAGGLTDVRVDLTVTDTQTGATHTYTNPLGHGFDLIRDTSTFGGCP